MLGQRYSTLPSKILESGDTIDLKCAEIAIEYEQYVKKHQGQTLSHRYSPEELAKQMEAVRNLNEHNTQP